MVRTLVYCYVCLCRFSVQEYVFFDSSENLILSGINGNLIRFRSHTVLFLALWPVPASSLNEIKNRNEIYQCSTAKHRQIFKSLELNNRPPSAYTWGYWIAPLFLFNLRPFIRRLMKKYPACMHRVLRNFTLLEFLTGYRILHSENDNNDLFGLLYDARPFWSLAPFRKL